MSADSVKVAIDQVRERGRSDGFKGGWLYLVREEEGNERGKCHYSPNNNRSSSNREREGVGFDV